MLTKYFNSAGMGSCIIAHDVDLWMGLLLLVQHSGLPERFLLTFPLHVYGREPEVSSTLCTWTKTSSVLYFVCIDESFQCVQLLIKFSLLCNIATGFNSSAPLEDSVDQPSNTFAGHDLHEPAPASQCPQSSCFRSDYPFPHTLMLVCGPLRYLTGQNGHTVNHLMSSVIGVPDD